MAAAPRKSAVQQLQDQMQKEIDEKDAELAAFKNKTKKYIEQLKSKHEEAIVRYGKELETLQVQMVRESEAHAQELEALEASHRKELESRESSSGSSAIKALEADKSAAEKALVETQARLQSALAAAAQVHVLKGELEQEKMAKEAAERELANVSTGNAALATRSSFDPLSALSAAAKPSQLTEAFSGFAGLSSALSSGDPSTSIFGSSSGDPTTSIFGSSAPQSEQRGQSPVSPSELESLRRRVSELESALQDAKDQLHSQDRRPVAGSQSTGEKEEEALKMAQEETQAARKVAEELEAKLRVSLKKGIEAKKALEAEKADLAQQLRALESELEKIRQAQGPGAEIENGRWGDAGGNAGVELLKAAEDENARLRKELAEAEAGVRRLERELIDRDDAISTGAVRVRELENGQREVETEMKTRIVDLEHHLESAHRDHCAEVERLQQEVEAGKIQAREMLKKAVEAKKQLQSKVSELTNENGVLRAAVASAEAVGAQSCEGPAGDSANACLKEEVETLEKALANSREQEHGLKEVLASKEQALRALSADLSHAQKERDALEAALETTRAAAAEGGIGRGESWGELRGRENADAGELAGDASEVGRLREETEKEDMKKIEERVAEQEDESLRREADGVEARRRAEEAEAAAEAARQDGAEARSKLLATEGELKEARREAGHGGERQTESAHVDMSIQLSAAKQDLEIAQRELRCAKEEAEVKGEEARKSVAEAQEQSREMLKKAVEAKKLLQNKITALSDENQALRAKLSGGTDVGEEGGEVNKLRSELDESRVQLEQMSKRLEEVLLEKEEAVAKLKAEMIGLETRCAQHEAAAAQEAQRAALAKEEMAEMETRAMVAERRAAEEESRAREAVSAASGSREQLIARQDELCRKLNDAEEAAVKARRKTEVDAAAVKKAAREALDEKIALIEKGEERVRTLTVELEAVKEAAGESESLREQVSVQVKELAAIQRRLLAAETEKEASTKMHNAELESVKDKSKQYIKKAVDQQKALQARVRELEEQVELVQGAASKAEDADAELAAAREAAESAEASLHAVTAEFERYKMRAHTLLKKADETGKGGRDVTGTLEDLTRQIGSKDLAIKTLREQAVEQEKLRAAAAQAADEHAQDARRLREELDAAAAASEGEVRILNLKIQSLHKEATSGEESRANLAFLTHTLHLEVGNFEARLQEAERSLELAGHALPLLQSQLVESQMLARDLQRQVSASAASAAASHLQQPASTLGAMKGAPSMARAPGMPSSNLSDGAAPVDLVGGLSPFDARVRSALANSAAGQEQGKGQGQLYGLAGGGFDAAPNESVGLAGLLTGQGVGAEGDGRGSLSGESERAEEDRAGLSAAELGRMQRELEEQRAKLLREHEAAQLYVSRMKEELASAISGTASHVTATPQRTPAGCLMHQTGRSIDH